eukprot:CAMPEP_0184702882 /NCGR_PEP_ID=MMETSP0313-20130426/25849_1 /TAXON_ID=2792 /ORGANISM="Porphyridium aerugineum, Strain SAG 1380-2" /LENGTH=46 /DNA_ID= /DNA_START= /DNA_END= /DNA_ORIENTATION=
MESSQTLSLQSELASIDDEISRGNDEMNQVDQTLHTKQEELNRASR